MDKQEKSKKPFPTGKIILIIALASLLVALLLPQITAWLAINVDIKEMDRAEVAYRQYLSHYAYPECDDFLYIYGVEDVGVIRDGKLTAGRYKTLGLALEALAYGDPKPLMTAEQVDKDGNLWAVTRSQVTANFVGANVNLTQEKIIGTGAEGLQFLFYNDGLELVTVSVPRSAIVDVTKPVAVTLKSQRPQVGVFGYGLTATNLKAGEITVDFLAPMGLSGAEAYLDGQALAAEYDAATGNCRVKTGSLGAFGIFYTGNGTEIEPTAPQFAAKLEYAKAYVYRVGNGNPVALGTLFESIGAFPDGATIGDISVAFRNVDSRLAVSGTYAPAGSLDRWGEGTIRFAGTGLIEITINNCALIVEVVDGYNITADEVTVAGKNAVLLSDITLKTSGALTISGGYTLFGNGFTITDGRTVTSGEVGVVHVAGGIVDNVRLIGYQSQKPGALVNENGRAPALSIAGEASVYNSYIYGGRYAAQIGSNGAAVYMENVTLDGGAMANIVFANSLVTLKNCVTTTDTRGGLVGMGILVSSTDVKLTLEGTFIQSNWLKMSDLPSAYSILVSDIYNDGSYALVYNNAKYINAGIFFFSEVVNFTKEQAKSQITDHTGNAYGYITKSAAGYTACGYIAKVQMAEKTFFALSYVTAGNYPNAPGASFDFTKKNYAGKMQGSNEYCVYNPLGFVEISFNLGGSKVWDTDILTVSKFGKKIPAKVTMNGVDYTGKTITFTKAGEYEIVYTYTDSYNYRIPAEIYDVTYTKTVTVKVITVDPNIKIYHPEFIYTDGSVATQVMANDKVYVMPDVNGTSEAIGSTVVGGKTIYYPIVTVGGSDSAGKAYASGKIYCFSPAFTAINIKDYHKDTGALLYTYDKTTQVWPHDLSASTKVAQGAYYGYGKTTPYTGATGDTYNVCKYNSVYGLSFVSSEIEREVKATTRLVEFYYVGNDGVTYYYYIQYAQTGVAHEACVTPETLVTLADGTKKEIQHVTYEDQLLVWNFYTGKYDVMPAAIVMNHGYGEYRVVTLNFADGTIVNTINGHGFFLAEDRKYVVLNDDNVGNYVGCKFVKASGDGYTTTELVGYSVETRYTESWSILAAGQYNCILADMWTLTPAEIPGSPDYLMPFEMSADMKYDEAKMQADIAKYGLYTYADFAAFMTEEQFEALGLSTWKVAVGKGFITWDDILYLIEIHID